MARKPELDRDVAFETGLPYKTVRKITRSFLDKISQALAHEGKVELQQFADLSINIRRTPAGSIIAQYEDGTVDRIYVRFHKRTTLTELLNRVIKEKNNGQVRRG